MERSEPGHGRGQLRAGSVEFTCRLACFKPLMYRIDVRLIFECPSADSGSSFLCTVVLLLRPPNWLLQSSAGEVNSATREAARAVVVRGGVFGGGCGRAVSDASIPGPKQAITQLTVKYCIHLGQPTIECNATPQLAEDILRCRSKDRNESGGRLEWR